MIEITGLWLNKTQEGEKYFSGNIGSSKILIFKNKYKTEEKHPDYKLCIAKKKNAIESGKEVENAPESIPIDEEIPF